MTDSEIESPGPGRNNRQSLETLLALADQHGTGQPFRALQEAGDRYGFHYRLYPHCIMFAPPSNRTRMLFTVWARPKFPGKVRAYIGTNAFPEFYPISPDEAQQKLGPDGWRHMNTDQVREFISGLDELFRGIPAEE